MRQTKTEILNNVNKETIQKSKFVGNNTLEITFVNGTRVIRLHDTNVVIFNVDGTIQLNSGGWKTRTTKERINNYTSDSIQLMQENSIWYVNGYSFYDYITFDKNGNLVSENKPVDESKINQTKQKIKKMVIKTYSKTRINLLV